MRSFDVCGLEMHSRSMWYHAHVYRALDFMERNGFNALIFHQSDIINTLALPSKYLTNDMMWEKFRGMRTFAIENNRNYLNNIIRRAHRKGIRFYLSIKEIYCPDEILELFPWLVRENNIACPSDPFWWTYIEACLEDVMQALPGLDGIILSMGTHEAKTSITKKTPCRCERCRSLDPFDWYRSGFEAVSRVLRAHGREFIVRDFSNSAANQSVLLRAAKAADKDVVISLKNTPHDYFPTFPDNPKIGTTGQTEWIEFDAWGQFYGMGIFPASIAEDFQARMNRCYDKGARGVYFRTDWEGMYENSALSTANILNLYAGGLLAGNLDADLDDAYRAWAAAGWIGTFLTDSDAIQPVPPTAPDAWIRLRDFMKASWRVLEKTVYVRTHWFCEDNMFPDSLSIAFRMMVSYHGRDQWDPGASQMVAVTLENMALIFAEKEEAQQACAALAGILQAETLGFPPEVVEDIRAMFALYQLYAEIGLHSCQVVFHTQRALDTGDAADKALALAAVEELDACRERVQAHLDANDGQYPHIIYWLLNTGRMQRLADDVRTKLMRSTPQEVGI